MSYFNFTDHPVQPNKTRVRLTHIRELSGAINEWHEYYGLSAPISLNVSTTTLVKSDDFNTLMDGITSLSANYTPETGSCGTASYVCENVPCTTLNNPTTLTRVTTADLIKALDTMQTFVHNVTTAQQYYCSNCDIRTTADNFTGCAGCDVSCNGYVACLCNGVCNNGYSCSCDSRCHNYCCGCHWEGAGDGTCSPCVATTNLCSCAGCNPGSCVLPGTTVSHYVVGCTSDGSVSCQSCDNSCNSFQCQSCYSQYYRYPWGRVSQSFVYTASAGGRLYNVTEGYTNTIAVSNFVGTVTEQVSAFAYPASAYTFVEWDDNDTGYVRSDIIQSTPTILSALFVLNEYDVNYTYSETNGYTVGDLQQTIQHGGSATSVTAFPGIPSAYELQSWSDGITSSTIFIDDPLSGYYGIREDGNVTADICAIPLFATKKVTLTYWASTGGSIFLTNSATSEVFENNPTIQSVLIGSSGVEISAVPILSSYVFDYWTDGYPTVTGFDPVSGYYGLRQDIDVIESITVSAIFLSAG